MADYRTPTRDEDVVVRRSHTGNIGVITVVVLLFATGFWQADVKEGALPKVEVPQIETKKTKIDVPAIGVRDGDTK